MNAARRVLSDEISRKVGGRRVVAAVFTTYSFDPGFFELEILPLLFESRTRGGFSHVEKVRRVQLEECLRDKIDIQVFYDRRGLVANAWPASLDFRRIDVGRRTGVFHPKLVLVLVENPPLERSEPTQSLIVATLSANLTRSGWWENLETGNIEVIGAASSTNRRCTFRKDLLEALGFVRDAALPEDRGGALGVIQRFVRDSAPREGTRNASWRGRYYTRLFAGQTALPDWLRDRRLAGRKWNLEVVSPFFDAPALESLIKATRPREVRVLLPTEADGTPTVTEDQFEAVQKVDKVKWSSFPGGMTRSPVTSASEGNAVRRVHAKVYRFWCRGKADVTLVGSVNLTRAAHSPVSEGNLEAAFLVNTTGEIGLTEWWLKPIDESPERFAEQLSNEEGDAERFGPALSLRYQWENQTFEYRLDEDYDGEVHIQTIAGEELHTIVEPVRGQWRDCGTAAADKVKGILTSTSFVRARIRTPAGRREWLILIREEGMTHKPSLLVQLTPEEILQYWSLLSETQRQSFLADRLETDEDLLGFSTARPPVRREGIQTVFDRFAGVFHAFERFSSWVDEKLAQDRRAEVTARLFGEKYDSLPVLLRKILERTDKDTVTAYVTFLSARQVVVRAKSKWPSYWAEHRDDGRKLERGLEDIVKIRSELPLTDPDRKEFLNWYEEMFVTDAVALQAQDDIDE